MLSSTNFPQSPETDVSSEFLYNLKLVSVEDAQMAYVDTGALAGSQHSNTTSLFIHGNPTSSYLWRNIIPHVSEKVRCVAPDFIGMGASSKLPISYRFAEHAQYLDGFIDRVVTEGKVILVIQDYEPVGRKLIIEQNAFMNIMLDRGLMCKLTAEEKVAYGKPYENPDHREPLFRWPNEIPIEGHPPDVYQRVSSYHEWLLETKVPKLFFRAVPGRLVSEQKARWYLDHLENVKGVFVGKGVYFSQKGHPHRI
ncbi:hypothetical protein TrVFT333_004785 [Trichoderma virens FT-333]|nr:hypothetical protein TrVFT333_004785 [Trichoderma virens FT-333]